LEEFGHDLGGHLLEMLAVAIPIDRLPEVRDEGTHEAGSVKQISNLFVGKDAQPPVISSS
jgi:hypothetical protein